MFSENTTRAHFICKSWHYLSVRERMHKEFIRETTELYKSFDNLISDYPENETIAGLAGEFKQLNELRVDITLDIRQLKRSFALYHAKHERYLKLKHKLGAGNERVGRAKRRFKRARAQVRQKRTGLTNQMCFGSGFFAALKEMVAAVERKHRPAPFDPVEMEHLKWWNEHCYDPESSLFFVCQTCDKQYGDDDDFIALSCDHSFHTQCLTEELAKFGRCPVCKVQIRGNFGEFPRRRGGEFKGDDEDSISDIKQEDEEPVVEETAQRRGQAVVSPLSTVPPNLDEETM